MKLQIFSVYLTLLFVLSLAMGEPTPLQNTTDTIYTLKTKALTLNISKNSGDLLQIQSAWHRSVGKTPLLNQMNLGNKGVIIEVVVEGKVHKIKPPLKPYSIEKSESKNDIILTCRSGWFEDSLSLVKQYTIPKQGYTIDYFLYLSNVDDIPQPSSLSFVCKPNSFLTRSLKDTESIKRVIKQKNRFRYPNSTDRHLSLDKFSKGLWLGYRTHFWCLLYNPQPDKTTHLSSVKEFSDTTFQIETHPGSKGLSCKLYAGPLNYASLANQEKGFTTILFADLWFWMRWLSLGLLFLLNNLIAWIKLPGIAIILLSLCVKVLMYPLTFIADQWQKDVNEKRSRLQPLLVQIKKRFKGEEQNKRILTLHKEQNIHPLYTLKSLFGFLIQIPIFFAAYHMLSENIALSETSFLWIQDLAQPDSLFSLPLSLPYFGSKFNLLPFLMTGITLLTSWLFSDKSLSKPLRKKQQRNLYWMALFFFILFYTFPAGMVLYWTTNNLLALLKTVSKKILSTKGT